MSSPKVMFRIQLTSIGEYVHLDAVEEGSPHITTLKVGRDLQKMTHEYNIIVRRLTLLQTFRVVESAQTLSKKFTVFTYPDNVEPLFTPEKKESQNE